MERKQLRALVVDDEPAARWLTTQALRKWSFDCQEAPDGQEAITLLSQQSFDLLVTDLRMPNRHGHSLAVEVLSHSGERPAIIVLTGVIDPRLAEDLLRRGVENIEFKPVDFSLFAAKARAICDRRSGGEAPADLAATPAVAELPAETTAPSALDPITASSYQSRFADFVSSLPISAPAVEVGRVCASGGASERRVAATVAPDRELTAEMIRLANSSYFNSTRREITSLRDVVIRLGPRRFAAHAQAWGVVNGLLSKAPSWIDRNLIWQRCLAAASAVERLARQVGTDISNSELLLLALLLPARRLVQAALYPERFEAIRSACQDRGIGMRELEQSVFPLDGAHALARLLDQAGIAPEAGELLEHLAVPPDELPGLAKSTRQSAELLRCGETIGRLAVSKWETWDDLDPVGCEFLRQFEVRDPQSFVERVRADVKLLLKTAKDDLHVPVITGRPYLKDITDNLLFFHPEFQQRDLLAVFLRSLGLELLPLSLGESTEVSLLVVSGAGTSAQTTAELLDLAERCRARTRMLFFLDEGKTQGFDTLGRCVELPCSIARICQELREFLKV